MKYILLLLLSAKAFSQNKIIVFQSDFGLRDGAVSAMKGVAASISPELKLYDLTHDIPAYNIWEAAYRLEQTLIYWPQGTVFVSVVDPGVGTERKSIVAKTKSGHFIVTPDNGTLTLIAESAGIEEVREINEEKNRRQHSGESYTFHGRDVYAFTGAKLASGTITFAEVGRELTTGLVKIAYQKATVNNKTLSGTIPVLDTQYGNVWTNIPAQLVHQLNIKPGNQLKVSIFNNKKQVFSGVMPFEETFGKVAIGKPVAYLNSLMQLSFALNQQNFAQKYKISSGHQWNVEVTVLK
jgi:S-adenosylmethionine hydrolase